MMDTVDYRSTAAGHPMLQDHHLSPYHAHHQHHQQPGTGSSRLLQSPSPSESYPTAACSAIDTSYTTLQPLPTADKFAATTSTAGLLGGAATFSGFMDEMAVNPYSMYKYDKLNGVPDNCSVAAAFGGGSGYGMMHNGYGGHHHQSSLSSLYQQTGYGSPNGFQLATPTQHHKALLDTKPPPQMMSPGPSPAYDPYSRSGILSVAAGGPPATPSAAAAALLLPPSAAPSPLTTAYGSHPMFQHHHHHHHHHGSPATSPSSRALHHSLPGPHRSLHSVGPGAAGPGLRGAAGGAQASAAGTCHEMEEINTRELAQKISSELKRYSIPQAVFAQRVLCRSQGTLSDLLRNPKPWSKLKSGRETFRRMWKWLQEPEYQRMSALRLAGQPDFITYSI